MQKSTKQMKTKIFLNYTLLRVVKEVFITILHATMFISVPNPLISILTIQTQPFNMAMVDSDELKLGDIGPLHRRIM